MKNHKFDFTRLVPLKVADLVRIGNKIEDGGYVICERQIPATQVVIGLGVNYDWTFEEEFKMRQSDAHIYCYDFSVSKKTYLKNFVSSLINLVSLNSYTREIFNGRLPFSIFSRPIKELNTLRKFSSFFNRANNVFFYQKGVSNFKNETFITFHELTENIKGFKELPDDSVYLKMDIEQSEYDIIEDVLEYKSLINGLAIEFHDIKHFWTDFCFLIDLILNDYDIVHIHGNNCCGYVPNTGMPNYLEITFIKKKFVTQQERANQNSRSYPLPDFDRANIKGKPDLKVSFS